MNLQPLELLFYNFTELNDHGQVGESSIDSHIALWFNGKSAIKDVYIPRSLLYALEAEMMYNPLPSVLDVAKRYTSTMWCDCLIGVPNVDIATAHIWVNVTGFTTLQLCQTVRLVLAYYILEGVLPTKEQIIGFAENLQSFEEDPDDYCIENRQPVPTVGLHNIPTENLISNSSTCSICTIEMPVGTKVHFLPCQHSFHACPQECLEGDNTILKWLKEHNKCPNCNAQVNFTADEHS